MKFFMYLLEYYAAYKKKNRNVLKEWDQCGIIQKIYDNYWIYFTKRMENAYMDI